MSDPSATAQELTRKARAVERRGDVILQATLTAWEGFFSRQTFLDHVADTGTRYPTIVITPDDHAFDAGTLQLLIRQDQGYQEPGLLIIQLVANPDESVQVKPIAYRKERRKSSE